MRPQDEHEDYDDPDFQQDPQFDDQRYAKMHRPRLRIKRWLVILGVAFVALPLSCCGGLLLWSSMFKEFELSNGQHLGQSAMNLKFDYEVKSSNRFLDGAYSIVAQTADGVTRDRPLPMTFDSRGTFYFNAFDGGQAEKGKSPVKIWIEKESLKGDRSKASNVISIEVKTN